MLGTMVATLALSSAAWSSEVINFDHDKAGALPQAWIAGVTGEGSAEWSVTADATAPSQPNVLTQKSTARFSWAVLKESAIEDGRISAKMSAVAGAQDQAGGLVWRWKDANNYYIARLNALEDNVILFSMVNGKRSSLKSIDIKVAPKAWHDLSVSFRGAIIDVSYDGKRVLEFESKDLSGPGKVGVWTKADSVTHFDNFTYEKVK